MESNNNNNNYKIRYEQCIREKEKVIATLRKKMKRLNDLITDPPETEFEKACKGYLNNARAITYAAYKEVIELIENGGEEEVEDNDGKEYS